MNLAIRLPNDVLRITPPTSDEALLAAIARGDRAATATLLARHALPLRAAMRAELGDCYVDAIDDLLYDVSLVLLFGTATSFALARSEALPWLVGVARRTAREHLRAGALAHYERSAS